MKEQNRKDILRERERKYILREREREREKRHSQRERERERERKDILRVILLLLFIQLYSSSKKNEDF